MAYNITNITSSANFADYFVNVNAASNNYPVVFVLFVVFVVSLMAFKERDMVDNVMVSSWSVSILAFLFVFANMLALEWAIGIFTISLIMIVVKFFTK